MRPDDETTETQSESASGVGGGGAGTTLTIKLGDFFFAPQNATAKAGSVTIEAPNEGSVEHELVLYGGVDEEKLDEVAGETGEVSDVEAGETKSGKFKLTPGKYVMFCNLPGHYAQGMYGTLTVTK